MRGILNDLQTVLGSKRMNSVQIARLASEMDGNDSSCIGGDASLGIIGANVKTISYAIAQNGALTRMYDHGGCGREGIGRHKHFVTGLQAERIDCQLQGGRG